MGAPERTQWVQPFHPITTTFHVCAAAGKDEAEVQSDCLSRITSEFFSIPLGVQLQKASEEQVSDGAKAQILPKTKEIHWFRLRQATSYMLWPQYL